MQVRWWHLELEEVTGVEEEATGVEEEVKRVEQEVRGAGRGPGMGTTEAKARGTLWGKKDYQLMAH